MSKWLAVYHHRHGQDFFFVESSQYPSDEQMEKTFPTVDWELEREDEYLEYFSMEGVEYDQLEE
jgi:hypothetical protein